VGDCKITSLPFVFAIDFLAGRRLGRIMSAYTDDRPFSIDLVGAVSLDCLNPSRCLV
jgi:hypothetical protein